MYESYLMSIQDRSDKYVSYATDLINYIKSSLEKKKPFFATHSHCTDGGVAGAMIRYSIPEAAIIPLDYWMINDPNFNFILESIPWQGIVDLQPFNNKAIDFWVDHHISARDAYPNANRIRFDIDGDSGSYQLLLSDFLGPLPEHLIELAVMTRITDTAGYNSEPPVKLLDDLQDLDYTLPEKEREEYEQRVWLLDDTWGSARTLKEHLDLYNYLAKDGYRGLSRTLDRVNTLRRERKKAYDIADRIPVVDIVAFSFEEDTEDKFTILRRLQTNGVKVAISLSITKEGTVKISFRRNRFLTKEDNDKIQVHLIAKEINGGGHPGASGAFHESIAEALVLIEHWAGKLGLTFHLEKL